MRKFTQEDILLTISFGKYKTLKLNTMKKFKPRKIILISALTLVTFICSSCSPYIWIAILEGMLGATTTPSYSNGSSYYSTPSSYSSYSSSSSSSSQNKCSRCNGTGYCQRCGGTGRVYDYGSASVISHEKYEQRCGVCNGTGKCGVCDGKGYV